MTAGSCQKCGKGNHKWYDCYSKEAVTTKVAGFKKTRKEGSNPQISAGKATDTEQRIEEWDDCDMKILNYGTDQAIIEIEISWRVGGWTLSIVCNKCVFLSYEAA